jgi:DHA3 family macrolide efflux protein-like MFS transporter
MMADEPRPQGWQRHFFPMWFGQAVSLLGSRAAQFALVWWLTQETGSATVLAMATLVALLPEIFLSPIAGAFVDRWNRRVTMIVADGTIALVSLGLAYLYWRGAAEVWHVYVALFLRSAVGGFHWPAMLASTSLMVPDRHLTRVAGLNQTVYGLLSIGGPPLGALLMAALSVAGVMLIDVGTAVLAIVPLLVVTVPQPRQAAAGPRPSIGRDLREGLALIAGRRGLVILIGAITLVKLALTPAFAIIPLLVKDHFGGGAPELSALEAAAGAGMVAGGVLLSVWGGFRRRIFTSLIGIVLLGGGLLAMGLLPDDAFGAALGVILVVGLVTPFIDGPFMAMLQTIIAPEVQGRVFTLLGSLAAMTSPLGLLLVGPVSERLGLQVWYVATGLVCVAVGLGLLLVPAVTGIEEAERPVAAVEPAAPVI